jgi:hypothetical protein
MTEQAWPASMSAADVSADYTNSVNASFTQWDVTLDFRFVTPPPGGAEAGTAGAWTPGAGTPVARLVMSPMHAKVLAEVMSNAVQAWETRFSALPDIEVLSPGLRERFAQVLVENAPHPPSEAEESK